MGCYLHGLQIVIRWPTVPYVRTPSELTERFRQQGLKLTPQRQVLFEILHGNDTHPSAEAVHHAASERMPGISLRTVYHTLTDLVAMGELGVLHVGSGPTRFDPNTADHHHSVCHRCGTVGDIYIDHHMVDDLAAAVHSDIDDFVPESFGVVIHGLCAACHSSSPSNPMIHTNQGRQS